VEHHVELGAVEERVAPTQQPRQNDQVRGRGDGQELGEALDDPDDDRLKKERRQAPST
jgi:hypothetical protein